MKAVPRPMSSLMLQLLSGSHIPPTGARPVTHTQHNPERNVQTGTFMLTLQLWKKAEAEGNQWTIAEEQVR